MEQNFVDNIQAGTQELGILISEKQVKQFYQYYELLVERNKVMNLTAITEPEDVITKHFLDSLSLIKAIDGIGDLDADIIDVGTGAGFPGIPLKIMFPSLKITLLDSLNKRIGFLNEVIEVLELDGIHALHGRAEDYGKLSEHRERYDYCLSRAVANVATLSEYCLPFVKVKGNFISYKSGKIDEELQLGKKAIHVLGGAVVEVVRFQLAGTDAERALVRIEKREKTPSRFPRKAGVPSKEPL